MHKSLKLVKSQVYETIAASSIYALSEVKKTCGGEDDISLQFRVVMTICMRESVVPVKTRSVKISYVNNMEIMSIQLGLHRLKVISNVN
jgi:hypothetical protein